MSSTVHQNLQNIFQRKSNGAEISPFITKGTYYLSDKKSFSNEELTLDKLKPVIIKSVPFEIGHGTFSIVYLYKNIQTNEFYAVKKMSKAKILETTNSLNIAKKEISIQSKINHKNILRLYNVIEDENFYYMILEYCSEGALFHLIHNNKNNFLSEEEIFNYFIQVVNAVYFLHENNLIHRDIKPENLLMNSENILKLSDFGWCCECEIGTRTTFCGTFEYMAPEIIKEQPYDKSVDIWALGILLYEMFYGFSPFQAKDNNNVTNGGDNNDLGTQEVFYNIINHKLIFNDSIRNINNDMKNLILEMLEPKIKKRYNIKDILNSPWIRKFQYKFNNEKKFLNNNNIDEKFATANNLNIIDINKEIEEKNNDEIFLNNVLQKTRQIKKKKNHVKKNISLNKLENSSKSNSTNNLFNSKNILKNMVKNDNENGGKIDKSNTNVDNNNNINVNDNNNNNNNNINNNNNNVENENEIKKQNTYLNDNIDFLNELNGKENKNKKRSKTKNTNILCESHHIKNNLSAHKIDINNEALEDVLKIIDSSGKYNDITTNNFDNDNFENNNPFKKNKKISKSVLKEPSLFDRIFNAFKCGTK